VQEEEEGKEGQGYEKIVLARRLKVVEYLHR